MEVTKKLYFIQNERIKQKPISYIKNNLAKQLDNILLNHNHNFGSYKDVIIAITIIDKKNPSLSDNEKKLIKYVTEYIFIIRGRGLFQVGNIPYTSKWDLAIYFCIFADLIDSKFYNRDHLLKFVPTKTTLNASTQTKTEEVIEI